VYPLKSPSRSCLRREGLAHQRLALCLSAVQVDHKSPRSPIFFLYRGTIREWKLQLKRLLMRPHYRRMTALAWRVSAHGGSVLFLVNCVQSEMKCPVTHILYTLPIKANIQLEKHFSGFLSRLVSPCLCLIIGNVARALYSVRFPLSIDTERYVAHRNRFQVRSSSIGENDAHFYLCAQAIAQGSAGRCRRVSTGG
jgi:hypothetical protein